MLIIKSCEYALLEENGVTLDSYIQGKIFSGKASNLPFSKIQAVSGAVSQGACNPLSSKMSPLLLLYRD